MAWIKVNLNGEDCAIYKGTEVRQILKPEIVAKIRKGELEILKDGFPINPDVVLENDCEIKIRAKECKP